MRESSTFFAPEFQVRLATIEDWATIVEFNQNLAWETEGKKLTPERIVPGVKTILADERHGRYFVACSGQSNGGQGRIVGQMMYTREWSDWRNGEIWWLQSVYVDVPFRRCGVFRQLYEHLKLLSENTAGVAGLRLYVERGNLKAIDAYRKLGMNDAGYAVMESMSEQIF